MVRIMAVGFKPYVVNKNIIIIFFIEKTGFRSDYMSLFFMQCSYFYIKNGSKHWLRNNLCGTAVDLDQMFPCTHSNTHLYASRVTLLTGLNKGSLMRGNCVTGAGGFMPFTMSYA